MKTFTKTNLITEVNKFYLGALTFEKALTLFELEYGYIPEIVEPKILVNQEFIDTMNYPEYVDAEALTYMKELQENGAVNMFGATPYIQNALMLNKEEARTLLKIYMKDYQLIYYPEQTL